MKQPYPTVWKPIRASYGENPVVSAVSTSVPAGTTSGVGFLFKQKTAYEVGLGIPAEPLFRSRHRLRRQNVGYSNFSQPQSHLSFCVLLQYLVERRRVVTQLGKLD